MKFNFKENYIDIRFKIENVFEYGSGNGTIWWASRSEFVRAVEHDASWYKKVLKLLPKNVELFYQELD